MEGARHSIDHDVDRTAGSSLASYDEYIIQHKALLTEIITASGNSAIYKDRISPISRLQDLSEIPLTSYLMIDQAIEKHGLDACLLIIPDRDVGDIAKFKKETLSHLLNECDDPNHTLAIGHELGRLDIIVTKASAYGTVQEDIDRRMKEGRSLRQLKPKRIHVMEDEEAFREAVKEKVEA